VYRGLAAPRAPRAKDTRHLIRPEVYGRVLALGILVRVLVGGPAVFLQVYVKLLGNKAHDVAVVEHHGNVLHQSSLASLLTACTLPFTRLRPSVRPRPTPRFQALPGEFVAACRAQQNFDGFGQHRAGCRSAA
jgi:hypothetical protein